jgi:predicted DNA-binding transcriptional regulator AlpA
LFNERMEVAFQVGPAPDKKYLRLSELCRFAIRNQWPPPRFESLMRRQQRQSCKIAEIKITLMREGYLTLTAQAEALGLGRSTTWTILRANHKASGLSASVIARMLNAPQLPPSVRKKILEYVEEKRAGLYGHNKRQTERFNAGLVMSRKFGRADDAYGT